MTERRPGISEDWLAVWIGLLVVGLAFVTLSGLEVYGWVAKIGVWTRPDQAAAPLSPGLAGLSGAASVVLTGLFVLAIFTGGAWVLGTEVKRFAAALAVVIGVSMTCWVVGHYAYLAATPDKLKSLNIGWSLNLTGEAGYILALLAGLAVGNGFPRLAERLRPALRPEWYIKTAIVILGAGVGVKSAERLALAADVLVRGLCAIIEAYLIYWPVVYFIARRYFRFSREWAAPLASGISICGVSAAIATGAAIRARPVVPVMVSSLVVIFAVVELLILPFAAGHLLWGEPMVAGAWMGLAVKTDGAALAAGAVADALIRAQALGAAGLGYEPDWVANTTATVKIFIDVFIGVWAFVLAVVWAAWIDRRPGQRVRAVEVWRRFPKFVLGYALTFAVLLLLATRSPGLMQAARKITAGPDVLRSMCFALTFFTIGVVSNFRKLWQEGIGRLAAVYVLCLFGFIIWVGLLVSWIFFKGVRPPLM
ncbi:MAG: putative sulfate exporter family transporter [Phycisphaerae bacterium]|jgi:uncharacterized membrane protein YadS